MIDTHFHIWQLARGDYGWLTPAVGSIYRDITLDDWRRVSRTCGVTGGILVQAAPTEAETRFLLQQARDAPDVLGVVGWVDMLAHEAAQRIKTLAANAKLKGLRPMLQDIADTDWILKDALSGLWTEAARGTGVSVLEPYMRHIMACFGLRKILWGSDWPVLELAGTYPSWHAAARELVMPSEQGAVFDAVARQVYRL